MNRYVFGLSVAMILCLVACSGDDNGVTCDAPQFTCGTECCNDGDTCSDGACVPPTVCADPQFACGTVCCDEGDTCSDGACVPPTACDTPRHVCGANCCDESDTCDNGVCVACDTPRHICGANCCDESDTCDNGTCIPPSSLPTCEELEAFVPCGGDMLGSWTIGLPCMTLESLLASDAIKSLPIGEYLSCAQFDALTPTVDGELRISESGCSEVPDVDKCYVQKIDATISGTAKFNDPCLQSIFEAIKERGLLTMIPEPIKSLIGDTYPGAQLTCTAMNLALLTRGIDSCAWNKTSQNCDCEIPLTPVPTQVISGPWTPGEDGKSIQVEMQAQGSIPGGTLTMEYCREDDFLKAHESNTGSTILYTKNAE